MLTVLRRIRKSLIESGSIQKYALYAIGEIALVVIGILIALQINNWNNERIARIEESRIIETLEFELKSNWQYLQNRLDNHFASRERIGRKLLSIMGPNPSPISTDSLYHYLERLQMAGFYAPMTAKFEQIINSNDINLIQSDSLKQLLIEYDAQLELALRVSDQSIVSALKIEGYLDEYFVSVNTIIGSPNFFLSQLQDLEISRFEPNVNALLSDLRFENLIVRRLREISFVRTRYRIVQRKIITICDYIENHYN